MYGPETEVGVHVALQLDGSGHKSRTIRSSMCVSEASHERVTHAIQTVRQAAVLHGSLPITAAHCRAAHYLTLPATK
jgi:hypothetical protein